jgi:hypothetical protein
MRKRCALVLLPSVVAFWIGGDLFKALAGGNGRGGGKSGPSGNGDVNSDGALNISDAIYLLEHLFRGGPPPVALTCGDPKPTKKVTIAPSADTTLSRDWNDECGPVQNTLDKLEAATRNGINRFSRTALRFDLPQEVDGKKVTRAVLRLYALVQAEYITNDVFAARLKQDWDETVANWSSSTQFDLWSFNGGGFSLPGSGIVTVPSKYEARGSWHAQNGPYDEWIEWDVTQMAKGWALDDFPNYGLLVFQFDIPNQSENQGLTFASMEYNDAALRPQLVVEWEE